MRTFLKNAWNQSKEAFQNGEPIRKLLQKRAILMDSVLKQTWKSYLWPPGLHSALVAVGGYGRRELHPGSDIDLLLLFASRAEIDTAKQVIETWLTFLWDSGLEVRHSVRTISECIEEGIKDVTVATNLMEARLILGSKTLLKSLQAQMDTPSFWPSQTFFEAKAKEQTIRHRQYHDTTYNLEPNLKGTPGGLRDIQTIGWIAMRYFGTNSWIQWVKQGFLLKSEYKTLIKAREFLWRVRFTLHVLAGRREDRLWFDYQKQVATFLGYQDTKNQLAIEQLMKQYYQVVMESRTLCELLLQIIKENLYEPKKVIVPAVEKGDLEEIFKFFIFLQKHPEIQSLSSHTLRILLASRTHLKPYFKQTPVVKNLFLSLLRAPEGVSRQLRLMKQYGILGVYLPELARVTGQMQYDLFHLYTVDEHTLFVIQKIRGFYHKKNQDRYPLCHVLIQQIAKPEILIIAALFHDIAKGRGGDHSTLGATDVLRFCHAHALALFDTRLISWLVLNHLLLSITAQKRDVSDPKIIADFAAKVRDKTHLDHLYLLTVADISATNPKLWNTWRASLILELYLATHRLLQQGLEGGVQLETTIQEIQKDAKALLAQRNISQKTIQNIWKDWEQDFFLRLSADDIAWQTEIIAAHRLSQEPLVVVRASVTRGAAEVFVYCYDRDYLFASITTVLAQLGLTIVDAQIMGDKQNYVLDTFFVLENTGQFISDPNRLQEIEQKLLKQLQYPDQCLLPAYHMPSRRIQHFSQPTEVQFEVDSGRHRTVIELTALDKPGLLAKIGQIFFDHHILLHRAKIVTIGEKVEDVFYVTDTNGNMLDAVQKEQVKQALVAKVK